MREKLLTTVAAAALIAGAGLASAQTNMPGSQGAPAASQVQGASPPPAAIQNAPAEKVGEPLQKTQDRATTGQTAPDAKPPVNAQGTNTPANQPATAQTPKADTKATTDTKAPGTTNAAGDNKATTTTGQGAAATSGSVNLSTEQRTKITAVIKEQRVQPLANVNFTISVGTRIPRTVRYHPLPAPVIAVYPAWRGYHYVLVQDEIVVIHPETFEIVAVIAA